MKTTLGKPQGLVIAIALSFLSLLGGCTEFPLLDPKGPVGRNQQFTIIVAVVLMCIIVFPVFVMTLWFPWKYRASNTKAEYKPEWSRSSIIEHSIWAAPVAIVAALSTLVWVDTHRLDPFKPLAGGNPPLSIQVISLNWKWLFIYPDRNIAVVNELLFPAKVPLEFTITSGTVMSSFFIPELGSQMYAMGGMRTKLNLLADEPGVYQGQNQQFSGRGYPAMFFDAIAVTKPEFEKWVEQIKQADTHLDMKRYEELATPGVPGTVPTFSSVEAGLFDSVLNMFDPRTGIKPSDQSSHAHEGRRTSRDGGR